MRLRRFEATTSSRSARLEFEFSDEGCTDLVQRFELLRRPVADS